MSESSSESESSAESESSTESYDWDRDGGQESGEDFPPRKPAFGQEKSSSSPGDGQEQDPPEPRPSMDREEHVEGTGQYTIFTARESDPQSDLFQHGDRFEDSLLLVDWSGPYVDRVEPARYSSHVVFTPDDPPLEDVDEAAAGESDEDDPGGEPGVAPTFHIEPEAHIAAGDVPTVEVADIDSDDIDARNSEALAALTNPSDATTWSIHGSWVLLGTNHPSDLTQQLPELSAAGQLYRDEDDALWFIDTDSDTRRIMTDYLKDALGLDANFVGADGNAS